MISRTTAYQTRIGATRNMFVVPRDGRIVAWTITLGKPGKKQQEFFEENLGGASQAGITVLKPGERYFGRVLGAEPARAAHAVLRPDGPVPARGVAARSSRAPIVALTVPTWAPALALGLGARQRLAREPRRRRLRRHADPERADRRCGDLARYKCFYRTARLAYSATLITTPVPPEAAEAEPKKKP